MDSIIFDLDGTLWDATDKITIAWNEIAREERILDSDITPKRLQSLFGQPMSDIAAAIFANVDKAEQLRLIDLCAAREHEFLLRDGAPLYPNLEETLKYLYDKYKLFIVSNCQAGYIEIFTKVTGLGKYFKGHLCPGDTGANKAENILEIISQHGLESPVYVGDTDGDNKASKKAGIPFVYAAYGFGETTDVDYMISDLSELMKLF